MKYNSKEHRAQLVAYLKENNDITEGEKMHALEILERRFPLPEFIADNIMSSLEDYAIDYDCSYDDIFAQEDLEELFYDIID